MVHHQLTLPKVLNVTPHSILNSSKQTKKNEPAPPSIYVLPDAKDTSYFKRDLNRKFEHEASHSPSVLTRTHALGLHEQ